MIAGAGPHVATCASRFMPKRSKLIWLLDTRFTSSPPNVSTARHRVFSQFRVHQLAEARIRFPLSKRPNPPSAMHDGLPSTCPGRRAVDRRAWTAAPGGAGSSRSAPRPCGGRRAARCWTRAGRLAIDAQRDVGALSGIRHGMALLPAIDRAANVAEAPPFGGAAVSGAMAAHMPVRQSRRCWAPSDGTPRFVPGLCAMATDVQNLVRGEAGMRSLAPLSRPACWWGLAGLLLKQFRAATKRTGGPRRCPDGLGAGGGGRRLAGATD